MAFLQNDRPTLTLMLKSNNINDILKEIERGLNDGPDAFGLQIEILDIKSRTKENIKAIFNAMQGKPAYVTNYFRGNIISSTKEIIKEIFIAIDCGAKLIDIPADMFDPSEREFTTNKDAIEKQKALIKEIHNRGADVLMSSHIYKRVNNTNQFYFLPKADVLRIALGQQERGADICKIVTNANTPIELDENFETTLILKQQLKIPFLFLCNGSLCYRHRRLGPILGSSMFLVTESIRTNDNQPPITEAKNILKSLGYKNLP